MKLFDLHCDTLYRATLDNSNFYNSNYHISLDKIECLDLYVQLMAIWIPDTLKEYDRTRIYLDAVKIYNKNKVFNDKIKMYLSVENAAMLNGNMMNFEYLVENDVKAVTLTWNDDNELGSGATSTSTFGLTKFGKEVVNKLEQNKITIDVSHASDNLFWDIVNNTTRPIIASHSNSRSVTNNKRNLTDDMFKVIKKRKGIVGLNFYRGFLNDNEINATSEDLIRHAEHFLSLGGEDVLAIGSDFDGADMPKDIRGIQDIDKIYDKFARYFGLNLTDKIFFENAAKFFDFFD